MTPVTIDHHRSASAACMDCERAWHTEGAVSVLAVLSAAAEHAIGTGHAVAEHVADDAVVHPEVTWNAPAAAGGAAGAGVGTGPGVAGP